MSLSKPLPILNDMPYQIKKMIVESIPSYLDRLPLRKVSKEFTGIVDCAQFEMKLTIRDKTIKIESGAGNPLTKEHPTSTEAINHLKCFVLKPNVTFSEMSINGNRALSVEVLEMLTDTVHRQLQVKSFEIVDGGQARLLEFMEPGTLERVVLFSVDQVEAESVFRMEQWRQAKNVILIDISAPCEVWWDFASFDIYDNSSIRLTDLPRLLERLINSDKFIRGLIYGNWSVNAIVEVLGGGDRQWKRNGPRFAEKEFPVGNHGSKIILTVFNRRMEFVMNRGD